MRNVFPVLVGEEDLQLIAIGISPRPIVHVVQWESPKLMFTAYAFQASHATQSRMPAAHKRQSESMRLDEKQKTLNAHLTSIQEQRNHLPMRAAQPQIPSRLFPAGCREKKVKKQKRDTGVGCDCATPTQRLFACSPLVDSSRQPPQPPPRWRQSPQPASHTHSLGVSPLCRVWFVSAFLRGPRERHEPLRFHERK